MAQRTYIAHSGHVTTAQVPLLTPSANTLTTLMQIRAPWDGPPLDIIEYGLVMNGSQINQGAQVDIADTGTVGATTITPFVSPYALVGTGGIASGAVTLPVDGHAGWPASGSGLVKVWNEVMGVTAGFGTNSWTVTRGVNGVTTPVTIPAGTPVIPVGGVPTGDIMSHNIGTDFPSGVARQLHYDAVNGLNGSGFWNGSAPSEGAPTGQRILDNQLIQPTNNWVHPYPLSREAEIQPGNFVRVRVITPQSPTVGCSAYIIWAE